MDVPAPAYEALSPKQQKFVDYYLQSGNATDAARQAGYGSPNTQGPRLLVNVSIQSAIAERQTNTPQKRIAKAEDVLEFLSQMMGDVEMPPQVRVRAAELLGRRYLLWKEKEGEDTPPLEDPLYTPNGKS